MRTTTTSKEDFFPLNTAVTDYSSKIDLGSSERIEYNDGGAVREPSVGKGRYDLISPFGLDRLAHWYEAGSRKYPVRNWEKGISYTRCIDSALRHINKFRMGLTDEDHLAAAAWNLFSIMHYQGLCLDDEFNDLPNYQLRYLANPVSINDIINDLNKENKK